MKIIGSDYDGTLNHNGIDDKKRQAIEKWRDAGNVFAIVSGKSFLDDADYDFIGNESACFDEALCAETHFSAVLDRFSDDRTC